MTKDNRIEELESSGDYPRSRL